jgi:hypothetical protein
MGISTWVEFQVINLVKGIHAYLALVRCPWGRRMKETISLERDRINHKGNARKIVIPLDLKEGNLWVEVWDEDAKINKLYQIM